MSPNNCNRKIPTTLPDSASYEYVEVALPQRQVRDGAYSPIVHTHQRRELQL